MLSEAELDFKSPAQRWATARDRRRKLFSVSLNLEWECRPTLVSPHAQGGLLLMLGARHLPREVWDDLLIVVKAFFKATEFLALKDLCLEVKPQKLESFSHSTSIGSSNWWANETNRDYEGLHKKGVLQFVSDKQSPCVYFQNSFLRSELISLLFWCWNWSNLFKTLELVSYRAGIWIGLSIQKASESLWGTHTWSCSIQLNQQMIIRAMLC